MNLTRLALLVVTGCSLVLGPSLRAQAPAPWTPDKQFSAEQVITTKEGMTITSKIFVDNGNARSEMNAQGMNVVAIMLPAQKKMYSVMVAQKMVMEMPLNDAQVKKMAATTGGGDAKFELVGPDTVDGTPCTKYKMTVGADPKVFYWWINPATKAPVKMSADDGSFTLAWKNYQAGPQDASLFQPPAGYQVVQVPAPGGGMPDAGGAAPGGGAPAGQ